MIPVDRIKCPPHQWRTSMMTGEMYCPGCHGSPLTVSIAETIARMDALAVALASVGSSCDWGQCDQPSVTVRWSDVEAAWLPVCSEHVGGDAG